ncbi:MAG: hypothetical protein ACOCVY_02445 [Patescibacteria group bacterium]
MPRSASKAYLLVAICLLFLFSGCSAEQAGEKLNWVDKKLGEGLDRIKQEQQEKSGGDKERAKEKELSAGEPLSHEDLTEEEKEKIDKWLEENGYNRYGDTAGAIYPGGTPLYNEETGESVNRYDHILKKFPNILKRMK